MQRFLFVLWLVFGEDFELNKATAQSQETKYSMADALKEKITWLLPLTYSGVLILYLTLLQLFPRTEEAVISASSLSALSGIGGIIGTLLAIALSKKYTKRKPVIIVSGLIMTASAFLMVKTTTPAVAVAAALVLGTFMFLPMTSLVMIPQELPNMTPSRLTAIMGVFWAMAYIIETIVFFLFGVLFDKTGSHSSSILIAVILSLSIIDMSAGRICTAHICLPNLFSSFTSIVPSSIIRFMIYLLFCIKKEGLSLLFVSCCYYLMSNVSSVFSLPMPGHSITVISTVDSMFLSLNVSAAVIVVPCCTSNHRF